MEPDTANTASNTFYPHHHCPRHHHHHQENFWSTKSSSICLPTSSYDHHHYWYDNHRFHHFNRHVDTRQHFVWEDQTLFSWLLWSTWWSATLAMWTMNPSWQMVDLFVSLITCLDHTLIIIIRMILFLFSSCFDHTFIIIIYMIFPSFWSCFDHRFIIVIRMILFLFSIQDKTWTILMFWLNADTVNSEMNRLYVSIQKWKKRWGFWKSPDFYGFFYFQIGGKVILWESL